MPTTNDIPRVYITHKNSTPSPMTLTIPVSDSKGYCFGETTFHTQCQKKKIKQNNDFFISYSKR